MKIVASTGAVSHYAPRDLLWPGWGIARVREAAVAAAPTSPRTKEKRQRSVWMTWIYLSPELDGQHHKTIKLHKLVISQLCRGWGAGWQASQQTCLALRRVAFYHGHGKRQDPQNFFFLPVVQFTCHVDFWYYFYNNYIIRDCVRATFLSFLMKTINKETGMMKRKCSWCYSGNN